MRVVINIDVPDLASAIDFYCRALGLRHSRTLDGVVAELLGASSIIYLLQNEAGSPSSPDAVEGRRYTRHWTPVHMDFVVEDLATATERVLRAGALRESGCVQWMGSKCITFSDPFGHGFCLLEFDDGTYRAEPSLRSGA